MSGEKGPSGCLLVGTATAESAADPDVRAALGRFLAMEDRCIEDLLAAAGSTRPRASAAIVASVLHSLSVRARAGEIARVDGAYRARLRRDGGLAGLSACKAVGMTVALAILLSAVAMTVIVGVRYLIVSGAFAMATRAKHPGLYAGLDPQIRREIWWSLASAAIYGVPAGVIAWGWQNRGWTRIYSDIDAFPFWYLPVSVLLYLIAHDSLVLLDASLDAPAPTVPHRACRPPCQPPAHGLGGDGVPPDRGNHRRCGNSATGVRDSGASVCARSGADGDDRYGGYQPYGVGGFPCVHVAGANGGLAHHREPSSAPP